MSRFGTVRDAKEYLIHRIRAQANEDGVSLSDVERSMLYFSESGWTLPNMKAVSRRFGENYDQEEYEHKIGQVVRRIQDQQGGDRDGWNEAVSRLAGEDHYLSVLIGGPSGKSRKPLRVPPGLMIRAILAMILAAILLAAYVASRVYR
jgi:hypothetical protein